MVAAEPVELAPGVLLLAGFHGDGADAFLVPVNAVVLGAEERLLVVPGARRAPWAAALAPVADAVRWVLPAHPGATEDLAVALACCRHARVVTDVEPARAVAGQFALVDASGARPGRHPALGRSGRHPAFGRSGRHPAFGRSGRGSSVVVDLGRRMAYMGDALGAPVLLPVTEAADLDAHYWRRAVRLHAGWAGPGSILEPALARWAVDVAVPAFGPVVRGAGIAEALQVAGGPPCAGGDAAAYRAALEGLAPAAEGRRPPW